jgi:CTD small phosphatase-like protein 2
MIDLPFTKPGVKKTIIFDLDETLAHCVRQEKPNRTPDVYLDIKLQSGKVLKAGFNIRPYTRECLEKVNENFEVIVFTASHRWYADVILDYIDPEKKLIQHRVYRDNCIKTTDNVYIKDLRVFKNREMKDMIIVDNAVYSFGAQLANGIPITPFKDDVEDREFLNLMSYLDLLKDCDDMRELNKEAFKMEQVY